MCGLAGLIQAEPGSRDGVAGVIGAMTETLEHRGPDDQGIYVDPSGRVALGFRRLAIIDLSELGHQPMVSASGRFTMVFNGEVFNHQALRRELAAGGATFRGHSDTETILAAFEAWGIRAAVRRFVGMFAIAVWDGERQELTLLRDRLGIKPLFIYAEPGLVTFGSELKALHQGPSFEATLDPASVLAYLRYLYVPAPATIFQRVRKLEAGHLLTIRDPAAPLPASEPFWSLGEVAAAGRAAQLGGDDAAVVAQFDALLVDAVRLRMEADVPLGALLSGGVDSSTVVAVMQELSPRPVRTFTIGFDRAVHDEAGYAREIAAHLGTDHTELYLTGDAALDVVPRLAEMYDEPLANPSQIPTYLVCQLARQHVTVALTGDGADELFAGYNRYVHGERMIARAASLPGPLRHLVSRGLAAVGPEGWDRVEQVAGRLVPGAGRVRLAGSKAHKLSRLMAADTAFEQYRSLMSMWDAPAGFLRHPVPEVDRTRGVFDGPAPLLERMMLADQMTYLPDDLLAKVDRASMAVSLEARVPLLDHRLVEFSWRLPRQYKVRDGRGKWILRQSAYRRVPRALLEREKVGFTVPIREWLRGPLRPWAEAMLTPEKLEATGLLAPAAVRAAWDRFQAGQGDDGLGLWALCQLQAWCERWQQAPRMTSTGSVR